jgi:hypothetical protein
MLRTNYDVIKGFVEILSKSDGAFKSSIKNLYALSLKGLSNEKDRDILITLTDIQALECSNQAYCDWKEKYNNYDVIKYRQFLADGIDIVAVPIKKMRGILNSGKKKNCRRLKKTTTRLYKDIKKVCKTYQFSPENHREFCSSLRAGFFAYREAIINIRYRLRPEWYNFILPDWSIIINGETRAIKNLYKEFKPKNAEKYYKLDPSMNFSKEDLRNIQLKIYPDIFRSIYKKRLGFNIW